MVLGFLEFAGFETGWVSVVLLLEWSCHSDLV